MHLCGLQACLSSKRCPWWVAGNPQEEEMIKLTANDLVRKSSRELTALFNQVTRQLSQQPAPVSGLSPLPVRRCA
jgi:hypothetical protein